MPTENLEIILRTHGSSNVHTDRQRFCQAPKPEVVRRCTASLVNAAQRISIPCKITVIDDHSDADLVDDIRSILGKSKHAWSLANLQERGYNHSAVQQFTLARDSGADVIYSVEDDYLHHPDALVEMIADRDAFAANTGREVCVFPFDQPDNYMPPWFEPSYLVFGQKRHWRTISWTTNTFMCRPQVLRDHWPIFEKLAREYSPTSGVHEGNTILDVWRNHVLTFNPIPSLALHMQFDQQRDPYIDWRYWWENYTRI